MHFDPRGSFGRASFGMATKSRRDTLTFVNVLYFVHGMGISVPENESSVPAL